MWVDYDRRLGIGVRGNIIAKCSNYFFNFDAPPTTHGKLDV